MVGWAVSLALPGNSLAADQGSKADNSLRRWWQEEKIRFFWGEWVYADHADIPVEETMKNVARAGANVVT